MMDSHWVSLAQIESFQTTELDFPETTTGILLLISGLLVLFGLTARTSLRDTRFLPAAWRVTLLILRCAVLTGLMVVLLNPRHRTQTTQVQPSRVGILIDTSLSMAFPPSDDVTTGENSETRSDVVIKDLVESGTLKSLSRDHNISIYTFDSQLHGPDALISDGETTFVNHDDQSPGNNAEAGSESSAARIDLAEDSEIGEQQQLNRWRELLQPRGAESRTGETLHQLIGQLAGRTLSGIVLVSDGRSNAGLDVEAARLRAERSETRLITVGVGSEQTQRNLWIAGMQSPTDVHRGDPFDISVLLQGAGADELAGSVRLFQQSAGGDGSDRRIVAEQPFELATEGLPTEVTFSQQLDVPGKYEYTAVAELKDQTHVELSTDDNQRRREVEVTDRKLRVLLISSGPMRDYQFVRNTLFRHSGIESDVWLQTVKPEEAEFVSQEAEHLLTEFPRTEAQLFEYDVIVAFDADWSLLTSQQQEFLNRWVDEHSGGIIFVAGELFTPEIARDPEKFKDITVLYPVILNRMLPELRITQRSDRPWPITLTPEGRASEFLKIADAAGNADVDLWESFPGIYRSYPVRDIRDGAVVLAEYGNPRARTQSGQPPLLTSQFYGRGRTMFLGSAETWRLRQISPEGHQRFWTSLIREAGQGRRSRGRVRGLLLVDRTETSPGQSVTIRAQLYDARMQPLQRPSVPVSIVDTDGRPVSVPDSLLADSRRPGQFSASFRPSRQGSYRLTVPVPESSDVLQTNLEVVLPNLEALDPSLNTGLLTSLTKNTGGGFLRLNDVAEKLASMLPDRSQPVVVDEQLRTLWDQSWIMYLLAGLLAAEWALRRVVRLS